MENYCDENCKQMQRERSGRKMVRHFLERGFDAKINLREGCVKKTIAPAVSKAE